MDDLNGEEEDVFQNDEEVGVFQSVVEDIMGKITIELIAIIILHLISLGYFIK